MTTTVERIYHTWDEWECYPAGFFDPNPRDRTLTDDDCREQYRQLLADIPRFGHALIRVLNEWPNSCAHNLSNERMNRLAWLGQAALCIELGIPSRFRGGYMDLNEKQKIAADVTALAALNEWLRMNNYPPIETVADAGSKTKVDLY